MDILPYTLNLHKLGVKINKDLNNKEVLLSLYKVHKSGSIQGTGLFANRDIYKDEEIIRITGPVVNLEVSSVLYLSYGIDILIQCGPNKWVMPNNETRFINHSCDPNMGFKGNRTFVARRNVKKGEELTFDYSMTEVSLDDFIWNINCTCGSKNCRKTISNKDMYNKKFNLIKKYGSYLPTFVQKLMKKNYN